MDKRKYSRHDMNGARFHQIWDNMKQRCSNKNNDRYRVYGGRGISVSERWLDFLRFKEDMYQEYLEHSEVHGEKNTTIDRINNNLGYYKENCRWATRKLQAMNQRNTILYKGESAREASIRLGSNESIVNQRIKLGWSLEKAFTTPVMKQFTHIGRYVPKK